MNHIIIYTDGSQKVISKRTHRIGTAAVGFHQGKEIFKRKIGLGGTAEIYDAELTGLVLGLKAAISSVESLPMIHHIHIYADCKKAKLQARIKPTALCSACGKDGEFRGESGLRVFFVEGPKRSLYFCVVSLLLF